MKKQYKYFPAIFFLLICTTGVAQDIHFSQYSETPLLINPASAGVYHGYYRAVLNYKNQWSRIGKAYNTFMGSYDMPVENGRNYQGAYVGLGAFVYSDRAGEAAFSNTQGSISVSCIVPLAGRHRLSAGLGAGFNYRTVKINALQWPNQYNGFVYDPNLPSNELPGLGTFYYFDMAAGAHYQFLKSSSMYYGRDLIIINAGAAVFHATRLFNTNREKIFPRIVFHSSMRYDVGGSRVGLLPSLLYMKQGPFYEIDAGLLLRIETNEETNFTGFSTESAFTFGLHYRYADAIIPQVFFEIANFGIGLSYDVNVSSFSKASGYNGGIEVSLKYAKMKGALYKNKY